MIVPDAMSKIRIVTPKSYTYQVIDTLYRLNLFHVTEYEKGKLDGLDSGSPLSEAEDLSKSILSLRSIKTALQIEDAKRKVEPTFLSQKQLLAVKSKINSLYRQVSDSSSKLKAVNESLAKLNSTLAVSEALAKMGINPKLLQKLSMTSYSIGTVKDTSQLKKKLEAELPWHGLKESSFKGNSLIALFFRKEDSAKVLAMLQEASFLGINQASLEITASQLKKDISAEEKGLSLLKKTIDDIKAKHKSFVLENEIILEEEIKKSELPLQFATTAKSFIAEGFVPEKNMKKITQELEAATENNVYVEELEMHHDENVPVKLNNPKTVRNFEVLTRLYELPTYLEVDPSILFFLTFPLFFGYMLGDVGYGFSTLFIFQFLKKKIPSGKQFLNVLIFASIISILFGFMFGEYFGFEHVSEKTGEALCDNVNVCFHKGVIEEHGQQEIVYSFPRLLSRAESKVNVFGYEILTVLFIGIIVGFIHLNFGFLIGFYNIWRAHGLKHAVLEKLSWIVIEIGMILAVMSLVGTIIWSVWVGTSVLLLGLVMLYFGEGVKGLIELPALFSNTLSYMRLGAVGLASVGLAVVVNENLAKPFMDKGGFFIIIALIIMILGHAINIGLGVLGPFLHSVRLHYVEFFSKFFHGGGQEYKPFGFSKEQE